jgi:hypothetical protein
LIHPSQIIVGSDVSVRYSTGLTSAFTDLGVLSSYSLSLQWQTKETIPVNSKFEESAKTNLKGTLNLSVLTDKTFEMPDPFVWIEIGLLVKEMPDGGRWMWNRTGKYLITNDVRTTKPDDMVQHQYTMMSQNAIIHELILVPPNRTTYWQASGGDGLRVFSNFNSATALVIL